MHDEKPTASADLERGSPESTYVPSQRVPSDGPRTPATTRTASSWTSDFMMAQDFAIRSSTRPGSIPIIYVADASNLENYFIDAAPLYDYNFAPYGSESEVISLGNVELIDVMWFLDYGPGGQRWE